VNRHVKPGMTLERGSDKPLMWAERWFGVSG